MTPSSLFASTGLWVQTEYRKLNRAITIGKNSYLIVYKVGKLGRFSVRQLDLRPGTYIVVGARDGYKDIRQKVVIKPGQQPLRITIICTAKI